MKRCTIIVALVAVSIFFAASSFAQSTQALELSHRKNLPEKLQSIQLQVDQEIRTHASWRSIPLGVDNPNSFKLSQDFENATYPPTGWTLEFTGTQYWTRAAVSGYTIGTGSSKFDFWNASAAVVQSIVTSTFAATTSADSLRFDYAQAYYNSTSIDSLILETSTDGGTTWNSLDRLFSSTTPFLSLSTTSTTSEYLAPTAGQWGTKRYGLPVGTNKIRFMAKSGFGNNLYIDNILVGSTDPNDIASTAFVSPASGGAVTPNTTFTPSSSFTNVGTATQTSVSVQYEIRNSVPALVYTSTKVIASIAPGVTSTVTFDPVTGGLPLGVYNIRSVVVTPDANVANDTINGTLRSLGPLTGTKTIGGATPDYPNFTSALGDLLAGGVGAGGVTFNVRPGVYGTDAGTEADTVLTFVSAVPGASASNPIIFQKQSGTVTIERSGTGGASDYIVLLNGTDYVTVDGIDLRQRAGSNAVEFGYVLQAASATDGAQNNTLKNFSVTLNAITNTNVSIAVFMTLTAATSPSGTNSDNKYYNFNLSGGTWGFQIFGTLGLPDQNTEIGILSGGASTISFGHRTAFNGAIGFGNQTNIKIFNVEVVSGFQIAAVSMYGIAAPFGGSEIGTAQIYNNIVHGFVDSSATTGNARAIAAVNLGIFDIYNNKVYDIFHRTGSTAYVSGISIENGTTVNVYNNFVSDIRANTGTGTTVPTIRAINVSGGSAVRIYNNTVYLDADNASVSRTSAALYLTVTPASVDIRNNILINNSANGSGTTGRQVAFAKSTTSLANMALTTNNNLLYAGAVAGSTNKRAIFYPATGTGDTTLALYMARVSPMDAAAVTENTALRNTTTKPYDLHVDSTVATRTESGGNNAPGVTTDIDGQLRVIATGPNVAPDIGADEFSGLPIDVVGPTITYTPLTATSSTGDRTLAATIKDLVSGVDVRVGANPRMYYKKNGGSTWTTPQIDSAGVRVGNVWTFTATAANLGGVVAGDTVYYYVAGSDSSGNVSTNPSGGSGLPPGITPPATANFYRVSPTISGSMTIGASGATFTTVAAAFDSVNKSVVSGAVTFLINADYAGDTVFPISLNQATYEGGGPFTVTLKPSIGASPVISGVSTTSIIKLNGADNVVIDGSNSGGTTRNLTISNTGTGTSSAAVWLSSLGAGAGAMNNTVKNCNLACGAAQNTGTTITFGIVSSGATIGTAVDGFDNDNNTLMNNAITKVRYGIYLRGATANTNDNNVVSNNLIGPTSFGVDEIGLVGITIQNQNNSTVTQNEVRFVGGDFANTTGGADRIGIGVGSSFWPVVSTLVSNSTITRNLIHDLREDRTFSAAGIVQGSTANPSNNTIANNMIYNVRANATPGDQAIGIGISAGSGDKIVYNSVQITGPMDTLGVTAASRSVAGIVIGTATVANLTLKNNISYVDVTSTTTTLKHYSIIAPSTAYAWGTGASNNNDYYINTSNPQMALGGIGTANPYVDVADLTAWRTQFTPNQDANSLSVIANFLSPTNLHIDSTQATPLNGGAAPIAGVTNDYDGQARNATTPDIGADEFTFIPPPLAGTYTVGSGGSYASLSIAIAALQTSGVSASVTFSLTDASYADTALIILPYAGQGAANPVTFKPATGVTARILISGGSTATAGVGIRMDSVSYITWDGSNSGGTDRSLTIESDTNTTTGRTPIFIRKGSRNVTLKNLIVKGNRHSAGGIPSCVVIDNTGFAASGGQHNMTVNNCQLMRGNNGLFVSAASGAVRDSNHIFINNLVGGASSASLFDHLAAAGITMTGNHNVLVQGNDVNGIKVAGTPVGIRVNGANTATIVNRNRIHNLVTISGAFRPLCILVGNIIATGPGVRTRAVISNNMIYDIHNFGTGAGFRSLSGYIYNPTGGANSVNGVGSTIGWFYNSMNVEYAAGEGGPSTNSAYYFDGNFAGTTNQSDSIIHVNNISSIKRADTLSVRQFLIVTETVPGNSKWLSNNNVYYNFVGLNSAVFAQVPSPFPSGAAVTVPDLAAFRDSTRLDSASYFGNPQFVSALDNHIRTDVPTPVESGARPIAGITNDFDGDTRNVTTPDIGADEGTFMPAFFHDIGVASLGASSGPDAPVGVPPITQLSRELAAAYSSKADNLKVVEGVNLDAKTAASLSGASDKESVSSVRSGTDTAPEMEMLPDQREQLANNNVSEGYLRFMAQSAGQTPGADASSLPATAKQSGDATSLTITPMSVSPGSFTADAPLNFRARVQNFGTFVESAYQVGWSIDGAAQTPVNNTQPLQIGAIDTLILTWATPTAGNHTARAWTVLGSDINHANDTASYPFTVAPSGTLLSEGFNDIVPPAGWHLKNLDGGGVTLPWYQGGTAVFPPFEGAGKAAANFNGANGFFIDQWLVTPNTGGLSDDAAVDSLTFWQRAPSGLPTYPDSLQIRVSTTDTAAASFTTVLDYFKADTVGWRRKAYALPNAANRYVAFRYLHYFGGPVGDNSNYVGLDDVRIVRSFAPTAGWVNDTSGITTTLYSVKAIDANIGWAGGAGGRVLRTINGGSTAWTSVGGGAIGTSAIYAVEALNANTAFATTSPGGTFLYRTINGGGTWTQVYSNANAAAFINDIKMFDANNGIAQGDPVNGKWMILKTSNGGATWDTTASQPPQQGIEAGGNNGMAIVGTTHVWFTSNWNAATDSARVYRSTNGGLTWAFSELPFTPAASLFTAGIHFVNTQIGVVGTSNGQAARTTNGGATWTLISPAIGTSGAIYGVTGSGLDFFATRGTSVYRSTDRGLTWAVSYTPSPTIGTFNHISSSTAGGNIRLWGVTSTGRIAAGYFGVTGVDDGQSSEIPASYALLQNYPNPFNPSTTIQYALPEEAFVTLKVYNMLGQEVAQLQDEQQNAGYHTVVWNGRNTSGAQVASGVYFYRIEAKPTSGKQFTNLKKMILLK